MLGIPVAIGVLFVARLLIYIVPQWLRGFRGLFRGIASTAGELRQARDTFNRVGSVNAVLEEQTRLHPERFVPRRKPEEQIAIPAAVRAVVLREFPGAKKMKGCRGAEDKNDLDVTFFEGDLYRCLTFRPDGTLVEIEKEEEFETTSEEGRRTASGDSGRPFLRTSSR